MRYFPRLERTMLLGALACAAASAPAETTIEQWLKLDQAKLATLTGPTDYKGWTFVGDADSSVDLHAIAEFTTEAKWGGAGKAFLSQTFYGQPSTLPATSPRITRTVSDGANLMGLVLTAPRGSTWGTTEWKRHGIDVGPSPLQELTGQGKDGNEESPYYQWTTKIGTQVVTCSISGFGTNFTLGTITRDARLFGGYLPTPAPGMVLEWLRDQRRPDSPSSIEISLPGSIPLPDALAKLGLRPEMYEMQQREDYTEIRFKSGYLATKRFPTYLVNQRGEREVMGEAKFVATASTIGGRLEMRVNAK